MSLSAYKLRPGPSQEKGWLALPCGTKQHAEIGLVERGAPGDAGARLVGDMLRMQPNRMGWFMVRSVVREPTGHLVVASSPTALTTSALSVRG
jgi:hypothetical protein